MMQSLSACHVNIRSLHSNFDAMKIYFASLQFEFTMLGVTETSLNDGGVGIFLKSNCTFCSRDDLLVFNDHFESVF